MDIAPQQELRGTQHTVKFTIAALGYPLPPVGGLHAERKYDNIMHRSQHRERHVPANVNVAKVQQGGDGIINICC
jgi:hypothetical protein